MITQSLPWLLFATIIIVLLILDLGFFNKDQDHAMPLKKSLSLSLFYIMIACCFGIYIYYTLGHQSSTDYFTGFLLEKTMSLDNIFVISIVLNFFAIPTKYQHRVLFWGIIGVVILRGIMIFAGTSLLAQFDWLLFVFAAILTYTGIKTLQNVNQHSIDINDLFIYKFLKSRLNIQSNLEGHNFIVKRSGKIFFTPLFMALIVIETIDLIFALDSLPAIFAITQDPFIVYSSNIFAILGLRALFFCLVDLIERFKYIKYSLAIILILIGIKIFIAHFIKIPTYIPLVITVALLALGIIISVLIPSKSTNN